MRAVQARANQVYRQACCKQVPPPFPWPGSMKSKDTGKSTRGEVSGAGIAKLVVCWACCPV